MFGFNCLVIFWNRLQKYYKILLKLVSISKKMHFFVIFLHFCSVSSSVPSHVSKQQFLCVRSLNSNRIFRAAQGCWFVRNVVDNTCWCDCWFISSVSHGPKLTNGPSALKKYTPACTCVSFIIRVGPMVNLVRCPQTTKSDF